MGLLTSLIGAGGITTEESLAAVNPQRWVFEHLFFLNNIPANAEGLMFFGPFGFPSSFFPDKKYNIDTINMIVEANTGEFTAWTTGTITFKLKRNGTIIFTSSTFTKANYVAAFGIESKVLQASVDLDEVAGDEITATVTGSATFNGTGLECYMQLFGFYDNT